MKMEAEIKSIDFESRDYQVELFELAIKKNIIVYLPTGSGKTFIATLLIKHFWKNVTYKPIDKGGKRTFFLVNTVALVEQQARQIQSQTVFNVGQYSGDMNVDLWNEDVWLQEINEKHVLVMTAQIFLDILQNRILTLNNVNLIIFDECHSAVSNHPMRQVMTNFKGVNEEDQPRVLGLTAALLNSNVKPANIVKSIKYICKYVNKGSDMAVFGVENVATPLDEINQNQLGRYISSNEAVWHILSFPIHERHPTVVHLVVHLENGQYSTNPIVSSVKYDENDTTGKLYIMRNNFIQEFKSFVNGIQVEEPIMPNIIPPNSILIDAKQNKINKRLINLLDDIRVNMDDLGVYGGWLAMLAHLVQLLQMIQNYEEGSTKRLYQFVITNLILYRHKFNMEVDAFNLPKLEEIEYFCSDKVKKLMAILKNLKPNDSAIIFARRRFTAKILYYVLKNASQINPALRHIKPNFIVGYNAANPFKDTRENYVQRAQNKKVMNQFNQGELNVLIASSVVEEGVDISQCNFVIMFDEVTDFRSYIQSKGRARDKKSNFIMMYSRSNAKFIENYTKFLQIEETLKEVLCKGKFLERKSPTKEELDASLFSEIKGLEPFKPHGEGGAVITALSAIPLINRYFASLKHDKFTKITPWYWLEKNGINGRRCLLQLPMESKVRGIVKGTVQSSKENAKRSAALEACKMLYEKGELDEFNLLPVGLNDPAMKNDCFTPNMDDTEPDGVQIGDHVKVKVGTKKYKRSCEKKWADCLSQCFPQPDREIYLHLIDMVPVSSFPADNHRLTALYHILKEPSGFAILTSKKLPKLASFPLYLSTGELEATVREASPVILCKEDLKKISEFHSVVFDKILEVAKKFMIRDYSNTQNSYLIAPIIIDPSGSLRIDWDVMEEVKQPFPSVEIKPSDLERQNLEVTDKNYLGKIVTPWYRTVPAQKYLVTRVCYDMSEDTPFPNSSYDTYKDYFKEKYNLEPLLSGQPLLEVRALSSRLNSTKPRSLTKQLRQKSKQENEESEVWLVPEYCVLYPPPGRYWIKAMLLPSALHRISQLCMAEELRSDIVRGTRLGVLDLPLGSEWDKLAPDVTCQNEEMFTNKQQAITPLNNVFSKTGKSTKNNVSQFWIGEEEPVDIDRCMDSITIFDITNFGHFMNKPLIGDNMNKDNIHKLTSLSKRPIIQKMVEAPPLQMLSRTTEGLGSQQVKLLQALTAAGAKDFINCERLETLGDSFLKFAISLTLFETQPDWPEGHLTYMKGKVVGNKNLFYCGRKKNLNPILEVHQFSPKEEWVPPGFCVEHSVQKVLGSADLNPNCLLNVEIPEKERAAGSLDKITKEQLKEVLTGAEEVKIPQSCTFINQQAFTDKNVSDAVEAILGTYLENCGIFGALAVLNWFQVTSPQLSTPDIFTQKPISPAKGIGDPNSHLVEPGYLEEILHYRFNDRCFLLEALTHPSYTRNNITTSYQRLEFLGDALIDFLITIHIYEKCQTLTPGDLTDLRSALVNNVTLACISVRNDLHKFLLHNSNVLNDCMMRFVKHQEDHNHVMDSDILFLFEERDVNIAESVDVPKALGDIIEALIGAIYLDCGKNIDVTWKVVYNLMKDELDKFHKDVPKNHVRMLYESECVPTFHSEIVEHGTVMVTVEIIHNGETRSFNGFGNNKQEAKRAAAKHALRFIHSPSNQ